MNPDDLQGRLGLSVPLMLAPMAGGPGGAALAAAVSAAGALGSLGAAYLSAQAITQAAAEVRARTGRPFALGLFAPGPLPTPTAEAIRRAAAELAPFARELGLAPPTLPPQLTEPYPAQFAAALAARPAAVQFTFGPLPAGDLAALRQAGVLSIGTATSLPEAQELAAAGVDAVMLQGAAAGGHRGSWQHDSLADTATLVRQVAAARPGLPLIAAGGLMTRAEVQGVLAAGAALAACGTAFLRAHEAGTPAPYRAALEGGHQTVLTRAYSGRTARGLPNRLSAALTAPLPFPLQNALTRELRAEAARQGRSDLLSLWAGEGYALGRAASAAQIVADLTGRD